MPFNEHYYTIQCNLSITDTLRPEKQVVIIYIEVPTIQRLIYMHSNLFGPTKAICYIYRGLHYWGSLFHCTIATIVEEVPLYYR